MKRLLFLVAQQDNRILRPTGLRHEVENGVVVLFPGTDSERERHGARSVPG